MKIDVRVDQTHIQYVEFDRPCMIHEIVEEVNDQLKYPIYGVRINGHRGRLNETVREDCVVDLLDLKDPWANLVYQTSLSLLYIKAVHDVLGKDVEISINNSLSKGVYTVIHSSKVNKTTDKEIEERMRELVDMKIPFQQTILGKEKVEQHFIERGLMLQASRVEKTPDLKMAFLTKLLDEEGIFYLYMVEHTGYLQYFDIKRYRNGMLLRFPHPSNPLVVPPFKEQKLLYNAFSEATKWERITNIFYAADLNEAVQTDHSKELVLLNEALHEKSIANIAEQIANEGKRIILIAGPSSSGKTTFAKRLCIQLKVTGLHPLYLGTDDYFREREETPLGNDGKPDFESLQAIDLDLFTNQMEDLLDGKKVDIPTFDFVTGHKVFGKRKVSIKGNQPIVIEGLHCLNPDLIKDISCSDIFKIYISPLTQLNIDEYNRVPTTDARMLRRMVRDAQFRNRSASHTIRSWHKVREGEEKYIFPYCDEADVFFNSHCVYELSILKRYAEPLLKEVKEDDPAYPEASRILHFLQFFVAMEEESWIPNNSIMREFIGGSILREQHQ